VPTAAAGSAAVECMQAVGAAPAPGTTAVVGGYPIAGIAVPAASTAAAAAPAPGAVAVVCAACGREGHSLCGQGFWELQRAQWVRRERGIVPRKPSETEDEEEEDDSDASQSTPSPQWGRPRSAQELNEQERLNLRAVLVAVDQPFPRLRRTIPLPLAVQIAHALWEDGSLGDEGMVARLSEAVRTFPSEVVGRTLSLGSNLRRWSEGIFASASNFSCAAATSPSFSRKNSETLPDERGGAGLRDSIRNRGGLRRGCSGSFVPSSPSAVSASGSTEVVPNGSDAQQGLARDVDVSEVIDPQAPRRFKAVCCEA